MYVFFLRWFKRSAAPSFGKLRAADNQIGFAVGLAEV